MRHKLKFGKLNRTSAHRRSLLCNMSVSLLDHERITTTLSKAKELRPFLERLITKVKRSKSLHVRRILISALHDKLIVNKLFDDIALRFKNRPGGYLRILRNGFRYGDNAPMAMIEFVD